LFENIVLNNYISKYFHFS